MTKRRCRTCPTLVDKDAPRGRCATCRGEYEQERGTTTERGYGTTHQRERQHRLDQRTPDQICPRCGEPLGDTPDEQLELDHDDSRTGYRGLAHALCNSSAGGRAAHPNRT